MKSDIIHVNANGAGVREALAQAEAVAAYKNLPHKDGLKLRLLAEEMMGLLQGLTGEVEGEFYIEDEDNEYRLHLNTVTEMDAEKRLRLMEASSSGENAAAVGILGKLRNLFECAFEPVDADLPPFYTLGVVEAGMDPGAMATTAWSLARYRDAVQEDENNREAWDELERSVIAKTADEIEIGIKGSHVEMTVIKKF